MVTFSVCLDQFARHFTNIIYILTERKLYNNVCLLYKLEYRRKKQLVEQIQLHRVCRIINLASGRIWRIFILISVPACKFSLFVVYFVYFYDLFCYCNLRLYLAGRCVHCARCDYCVSKVDLSVCQMLLLCVPDATIVFDSCEYSLCQVWLLFVPYVNNVCASCDYCVGKVGLLCFPDVTIVFKRCDYFEC